MADRPDPTEDPADAGALHRYADALADAVDAAIPAWIEAAVLERVAASGRPLDDAVREAARAAGARARDEGGPAVRDLLATDIDEQRTTPLTILRALVRHATAALHGLGVPEVERDRFDAEAFPDDVYGITPAAFSDVHPSLHEPAIEWGAAKAHVHLRRHRSGDR